MLLLFGENIKIPLTNRETKRNCKVLHVNGRRGKKKGEKKEKGKKEKEKIVRTLIDIS